jgi:uncharacterized protein YndB with AHSA1/START domain
MPESRLDPGLRRGDDERASSRKMKRPKYAWVMSAMPPPLLVRVSREFTATPERVFDAWLDPDLIGRWMFGPALRDETIVRVSVDARVGGRFSFLVRRGGAELDHVGEYLVLDRPHRLTFTWSVASIVSGDSRVTVDIVRQASGCVVEVTHALHPDWGDYADRTRDGWARMLDVLAATRD